MPVCSKCKLVRGKECFSIDKRYNSYRHWCRDCTKIYLREYYLKNRPPLKPKIVSHKGYKLCKKCNTEKKKSEFYGHGGHCCKSCHNKNTLSKYYSNPIFYKDVQKRSRQKNITKIKIRAKERRIRDNHSKYSADKMKQYRADISDSYVKAILRNHGIANEEINKDMVEQKRIEILLKRLKKVSEEKIGLRICTICKKAKLLKEFSFRKWVWKGEIKVNINNVCYPCSNERIKSYKKKISNDTRTAKRKGANV